MSLLISLRAENLKTKRTASLYLAITAAAFGPLMSLLDMMLDEGISASDSTQIFNKMLIEKFQMTALVVFPIFLIMVCTLLPQIEYRNNTWKQVLTSPQTKGNVFMAKFINVHFLIVVFLLTNQLMMLANAVIIHFAKPSLNLLSQPVDWYRLLVSLVNIYVALLAICAIQFWLGLRFKNFIAPIGIGIALWFAGTIFVMVVESSYSAYFPYSFHVYGTFPKFKSQLANVHWASVGYAVLFLVIGFYDFKRRSIKN